MRKINMLDKYDNIIADKYYIHPIINVHVWRTLNGSHAGFKPWIPWSCNIGGVPGWYSPEYPRNPSRLLVPPTRYEKHEVPWHKSAIDRWKAGYNGTMFYTQDMILVQKRIHSANTILRVHDIV
jgi:hypothetical protein